MKTTLHRVSLVVALVGALAAGVAQTAVASVQGRDTGTIRATVSDPDGRPLPGVMVTVEGPLGTRSVVTSTDGSARIPGLAPGTYETSFTLDGFKTIVRPDLRVSVARTLSVSVQMELSDVQETITVRGESPLVDVRTLNVGTNYTDELVDRAPTASGLWAGVLDHIPGIVMDDPDVGGSMEGDQRAFGARGALFSQNVYNLNGANTSDPDVLGASAMYYSVESFEQVSVSTAAHDLQTQTPGVTINMVSKTGSNDWSGAAKLYWEDEDLVSENVDEELLDRGSGEGNPTTFLTDLDLQLGGPIVRDKAWFFVDFWRFDRESRIIGVPGEERDVTELTNWTFNGTWQPRDDHKLTARYFTNRRVRPNHAAGPFRPPQSAWDHDSFVDIPQLQYQGIFGGDTFVDVRFSKMDKDHTFLAKPVDDPPVPSFDVVQQMWSGPVFQEFISFRDRSQLNGELSSYFSTPRTGHDVKVGASYNETQVFEPLDVPGGVQQFTAAGAPLFAALWNSPPVDVSSVEQPNAALTGGRAFSLFGQDSWTFDNRLTVSFGLRYDWSKTFNPDQRRPESRFCGMIPASEFGAQFCAAEVPGEDVTTEWSDLAPRISAVYDVTDDGRTALKVSWARYTNQQGAAWAQQVNANSAGQNFYFWGDANGDGVFQFGEQTLFLGGFFPSVTTRFDEDLDSPITEELSVGIEREILDGLLFSGTFVHRDQSDIVERVEIGNPFGAAAETLGVPSPYTPVQVTDPGPDGVLGTADDGGALTVFAQDPASFGQNEALITNPEKFGFDPEDTYKGVSLVLQKRWADNWQLLASWDIGESVNSSGRISGLSLTSTFTSPNGHLNAEGLAPLDRTHIFRLTGNYLFSEPIGVNLGVFLRVQSGAPLSRTAVFTLPQGDIAVQVAPAGEDPNAAALGERYDTLSILDVRAEKQFTLGGRWGRLNAYVDVFNLFNTNTVNLALTNSGSAYGDVLSFVPPRVVRIGGAWSF